MGNDAEMAAHAAGTAERFAGALIAGDAGTAARLFSPAGTCLSRDGTEVRGPAAIGALLRQVTDSEHRLAIHLGRTIIGGDVAFSTQFWTQRSRPPEREGFESISTARLVLGRGGSGWEILIASPWE